MNDFYEKILEWIEADNQELFLNEGIREMNQKDLARIIHSALYDLFMDEKLELKASMAKIYDNANNTDFVIDEAGKYL